MKKPRLAPFKCRRCHQRGKCSAPGTAYSGSGSILPLVLQNGTPPILNLGTHLLMGVPFGTTGVQQPSIRCDSALPRAWSRKACKFFKQAFSVRSRCTSASPLLLCWTASLAYCYALCASARDLPAPLSNQSVPIFGGGHVLELHKFWRSPDRLDRPA